MSQASARLSTQSQAIDFLRFPMAALVVLLHTAALGLNSTHPVYSTLSIALGRGICRVAVPCFFLISGYLFFSKLENIWDTQVWIEKLKKRVRTLLVPYVLWNAIAAVAIWGYRWFFARAHGESYPGFLDHIVLMGGLWDNTADVSFDGPLWFIRHLMVFVIAAPLVWLFVKHLRLWGLVALILVFIVIGHIPEGIVFFTSGAWLRVEGKNILTEFDKIKNWSTALALLSLIALTLSFRDNPECYRVASSVFILTGTPTLFLLAEGVIGRGITANPFLTRSSFFIFATHNILILHDFSHWIILHLLPFHGEWIECVDLFLRPSIAIAICLTIFKSMEHFTPKLLAVLTGGRG